MVLLYRFKLILLICLVATLVGCNLPGRESPDSGDDTPDSEVDKQPNSNVKDASSLLFVQTEPQDGQQDISPDSDIILEFSQALDLTQSLDQIVSIKSDLGAVNGRWEFVESHKLKFSPHESFKPTSTIRLNVTKRLVSEDGASLDKDVDLLFSVRAPDPIQISDHQPVGYKEPLLAYDRAGNGLAVWKTNDFNSRNGSIFFASYNQSENKWSEEERLCSIGFSNNLQVVSDGDVFLISWWSDGQTFAVIYDADDNQLVPGLSLNSRNECSPIAMVSAATGFVQPDGGPYLASKNGEFIFIWDIFGIGGLANGKLVSKRLFQDQNKMWRWESVELPVSVSQSRTQLTGKSLVINSMSSDYFLSWVEPEDNMWHLKVSHLTSGGSAWSDAVTVFKANEKINSLSVVSNSDTLFLAWAQAMETGSDLKASFLTINEEGGLTFTESHIFAVSNRDQLQIKAAANEKTYIAAWEDQYLFAATYENGQWNDAHKIKNPGDISDVNSIASIASADDSIALVTGSVRVSGAGGGGGGRAGFNPFNRDFSSNIYIHQSGNWQESLALPTGYSNVTSPYIVNNAGIYHLAWVQPDETDNSNIVVSQLNMDEESGAKALLTNTYPSNSRTPQTVSTQSGHIVNTWLQTTNGVTHLFMSFYDGQQWSKPKRITGDEGLNGSKVFLASHDNEAIIVWSQLSGSFYQVYNEDSGLAPALDLINSDRIHDLVETSNGLVLITSNMTVDREWALDAISYSQGIWKNVGSTQTGDIPLDIKIAVTQNGMGMLWRVYDEKGTIGTFACHLVWDGDSHLIWSVPHLLSSTANGSLNYGIAGNDAGYVAYWSEKLESFVGESSRSYIGIKFSALTDTSSPEADWLMPVVYLSGETTPGVISLVSMEHEYLLMWSQSTSAEPASLFYRRLKLENNAIDFGESNLVLEDVSRDLKNLRLVNTVNGYLASWWQHEGNTPVIKALRFSLDNESGLPFTLIDNPIFNESILYSRNTEGSLLFMKNTPDEMGGETAKVFALHGL